MVDNVDALFGMNQRSGPLTEGDKSFGLLRKKALIFGSSKPLAGPSRVEIATIYQASRQGGAGPGFRV